MRRSRSTGFARLIETIGPSSQTTAGSGASPGTPSGVSGKMGGPSGFHCHGAGLTVVSMAVADDAGGVTTAGQGDRQTGGSASMAGWITPLQGLASIGAGAIHAAAVGIHAEHPTLSRLFVAVAAAQIVVGLVTLARGGRTVAAATVLVNGAAVAAWIVTRVS